MLPRTIRPVPFVMAAVMLAVIAIFSGYAGRDAYTPVASVAQTSRTVGIADSDLYSESPEDVNTTLDKMTSLGVENVRVLVPWSEINPAPFVYDWSKMDRVVAAAHARNMGILGVVTHSPPWAVAPGSIANISAPSDPALYGDFLRLVAQRFDGSVSAYEIWNEPNAAVSFFPAPDAARYTALLVDAYAKIKSVDPSITVVAGAFGAIPTLFGATINSPTFLQQMYAAGAKGHFDALSFHPYQNTTPFTAGRDLPGSPLNEVGDMRNQMVSQGDGAKQIWATEYGLPTATLSEQQQADYISDFLAGWGAQDFAGPMFVYSTKDRNSTSSDTEARFGLFRDNFSPKPAAQRVADYIAGTR